jgi:acyl carrier protein
LSDLGGTSTPERVRAIMSDRLHIDVGDGDANLIDTGLIDSMSLVELFVALEEEFGINVADEDLDLNDFRTLNSVVRFTERHL